MSNYIIKFKLLRNFYIKHQNIKKIISVKALIVWLLL